MTFAISYGIEMMILAISGANPKLSVYITNFGLNGATNEISLSFTAVVICVIGNVVNGFWHIISCVLGVKDGSLTIGMAFVFAIGYVVLAGILAIEWGTCVNMTGVLWVGMFEHFFNNFVSNAVHVLSTGTDGIIEADNMQILRIVLSNILSLTIVLVINSCKKSREND